MSDLRILHIRSSYFYGGPERQISYLNAVLERQGIPSGVATFVPKAQPDKNKYWGKLEELGHTCHRLEISGSFDKAPVSEIKRLVNANNYNLIVAHDYRADYFAIEAKKGSNVSVISFSRGWTRNTWKVRLYEHLDLRFLKKMDGVVAVSKQKYDELLNRGIAREKLIYIPNSILLEDIAIRKNSIRDRFKIPHDAYLVGTAGRLSVEKNQEVFIKAACEVMETSGNDMGIYFIIAGDGPRYEDLRAMIPDKFKSRVFLAGWIENSDAFYADIDLFVLTSLTEGFPNVLLEAGKYSLPAISTPAGGAPEIIASGTSGHLFEFGDHEKLAELIRQMHNSPDEARKLGLNLNAVTCEKFDASENAAKFLEFVKTVRGRHG